MEVQGKIWGQTSLLFNKNNVEIHRIVGLAGGYSSNHRHAHKFNLFFIERGLLKIKVWRNGMVDEVDLGPGQSCTIGPGEWHQFVVLEENTVAYEVYWTEIEPTDIERNGHGGRTQPGSGNRAIRGDGPSDL